MIYVWSPKRVVAWLSTCRMCWPTRFRGRPKIHLAVHKTSWVSIHSVWTAKNRRRWMSTRLRGRAQDSVGTQVIVWPSKDFVDGCGCPRPKTFRGCPYNVMDVQNSWVSITSRGRWWTWFVGGCVQMWWPETWDSTVQSGRPKLRGGAWTMVGAGGGEPWKFVEARGSVWTANFVGTRGYTSGRPKSRCLGRPCRTRVDAHYRGACWMSMCAQDGCPTHTHVGHPGRVDMDTQNGCVHVHTSMPRAVDTPISHTSSTTKLFTRRLRLVRQVFQNFLCSNA